MVDAHRSPGTAAWADRLSAVPVPDGVKGAAVPHCCESDRQSCVQRMAGGVCAGQRAGRALERQRAVHTGSRRGRAPLYCVRTVLGGRASAHVGALHLGGNLVAPQKQEECSLVCRDESAAHAPGSLAAAQGAGSALRTAGMGYLPPGSGGDGPPRVEAHPVPPVGVMAWMRPTRRGCGDHHWRADG